MESTGRQALTMHLHPDALYDAPYEQVALDLSRYRGCFGSSLLSVDLHGVDISAGRARLRVDVWEEGVLRLRLVPGGEIGPSTTETLKLISHRPQDPPPFEVQDGDAFVLRTRQLQLEVRRPSMDILLKDHAGTVLWQTVEGGFRFSDTQAQYGGHRFFCASNIGDQRFYGFGGRIAPLDRTGQTVDVFSVKTGTVAGDYGGFPLPFFVSDRGYGFFLNDPWPHVYFDMGRTDPRQWLLHAPGGECDVFLLAGPRFPDVVRRFTALTGRVPLVPRWMLGFWCSSLSMTTAEQALADAHRMRGEQYPCDAFVFDGPWRGGPDFAAKYVHGKQYPSEDLEWHKDFGRGPEMITRLGQLGIKTVLHLNSRSFSSKTATAGVERGLLRRHGEEVVPRVLHGPAEKYYCDLLTPRIREHVAAWWTDHADRVSGELRPGVPSRNLFGVLWNRLLSDLMVRHGVPAAPSLSRGGGIGSQRYAIPWPGDTRCGVDGLAEDIWFMLNAGLAGFAISSADLGGFVSRRDPVRDKATAEELHAEMFDDENLCRRLCHCLLYIPVPRIHNNCDTIPKFPWNCSAKVQRLYKQALEDRYRLTPYLYSYAIHSSRSGEPLLRPLVYEYPRDPNAAAASTQFFLGDWLLIAPVTEAGERSKRVYLPPGRWFHMWSGRAFEGPAHVEVPAPLYELAGLPVFVRAGAILCRQDLSLHLEECPPGRLLLELYPSGKSECELHESPNVSHHFACEDSGATVRVAIENKFDFPRRYVLRIAGQSDALEVEMPAHSTKQVDLIGRAAQ